MKIAAAVSLLLGGCYYDRPVEVPVYVQVPVEAPPPKPAPVKRQIKEIKNTIGKLHRALKKREDLAPLPSLPAP